MIRTPLRALTFDLDGTLWSVDDVLAAAEEAVYAYLQEAYPSVAARYPPEAMRALRRELAAADPELARNATRLRRETMRQAARRSALAPAEVEPFVERTFELFLEQRQARVAPYPEVPAALAELARRLRIGVITNGNADVYRTALAPYVDFVIRGVDLDIPKPEPGIFQAACRAAGAAPGEILHIGDDPEVDARGAQRAGMQAALLCRDPAALPEDGEGPDCLVVPDAAALQRAVVAALDGGEG